MGVPQEGETYLDALEGRDLMYELLRLFEKGGEIEGDALTQFMADNLDEQEVVDFIKEQLGERIKEYDDT